MMTYTRNKFTDSRIKNLVTSGETVGYTPVGKELHFYELSGMGNFIVVTVYKRNGTHRAETLGEYIIHYT